MNNQNSVLQLLEIELENHEQKLPKPLACDKHLASSVLQKSIRRGMQETASRAAVTFWNQDRVSFWRRLAIICIEDCGGAPEEITKTLAAFNNSVWRTKVGDLKVALYLTKILCMSTKLRLADEVISTVANGVEFREQRQVMSRSANPVLADTVLDGRKPFEERALALWMLAGTRRFPHDGLPDRVGCLDWTTEILVALGAPVDLTQACIDNLPKSRWPLSLLMPLIAFEVERQPRPLLTWFDKFPASPVVQGIPLVAADGFTRIGKSSFLEFQKIVPELRFFSPKQIALGVFFTRGYCVDKRLTNDWLDDLRQQGEIADMEGSGLDLPRHMALREIIIQTGDRLETIQTELLKNYLRHSQADLFEVE